MARPCTPEELHNFFDLDKETGLLYWRHRPEEMFPSFRIYRVWNSRLAGKRALTYKNPDGYYVGALLSKPIRAHAVVWAMTHGAWPTDEIDHINGDPVDNRPENLREVTHRANVMNRAVADTATGMIGINRNSSANSYRVRLAGRYFGSYRDLQDAIKVRDKKLQELGFHPNHGRAKRSAA